MRVRDTWMSVYFVEGVEGLRVSVHSHSCVLLMLIWHFWSFLNKAELITFEFFSRTLEKLQNCLKRAVRKRQDVWLPGRRVEGTVLVYSDIWVSGVFGVRRGCFWLGINGFCAQDWRLFQKSVCECNNKWNCCWRSVENANLCVVYACLAVETV